MAAALFNDVIAFPALVPGTVGVQTKGSTCDSHLV